MLDSEVTLSFLSGSRDADSELQMMFIYLLGLRPWDLLLKEDVCCCSLKVDPTKTATSLRACPGKSNLVPGLD